jgi:hypothetical protein
MTRAQILRNGSWIEEKWTLMKTTLACGLKEFYRSGQMTLPEEAEVEWLSEKEVSRWIYHANTKNRIYPDVLAYSYLLFEKDNFVGFGKVLEKGLEEIIALWRRVKGALSQHKRSTTNVHKNQLIKGKRKRTR